MLKFIVVIGPTINRFVGTFSLKNEFNFKLHPGKGKCIRVRVTGLG
jgi:hypothetical protein